MSNSKHIPIRKCIACGKRENKDLLLRIVRVSKKNDQNKIFIFGDKENRDGRGYYLCKSQECLKIAKKKKKFERIFKKKLDDEIYGQLEEAMQNSE